MRHAMLDANRVITNIIEIEPSLAPDFGAHYLGEHPLGIGDTYPAEDLTPPAEPTNEQRLAALESALLELKRKL